MEIDEVPVPGHDQPTRQRVARSILVDGPSTAAALAERLDLTPAAVRRHLDQLVEEGAVEAREPRSLATRGRGRPAKVFALTETGRDRFDQQYDDLAVQALRFLAETEAISAVLGRHVQRLATIAHGDGVCTTCIPDVPTSGTTSSITDKSSTTEKKEHVSR